MKLRPQVEGFILGGGSSTRMGEDKGLLEIDGVPLIIRTARLLEQFVASVTVVGSPDRYAELGLRAIGDQELGAKEPQELSQGPLAGIARALSATSAPWNLVVACDLPYLTGEWLDWLLSRALGSCAEVVVPRTRRGLEPLAAVYRRECGARFAAAFDRGVRKTTEALREFRTEAIDMSQWHNLDPDGRLLKNMNTPEDYQEARSWWEARARNRRDQVTPRRKRQGAPHRRR